ncbi:MAG TPA: hypothetical protein VH142_27930 [Polyangiaceae bacterium]|nr:hypothetical protein [Polyangiaceae bacterium]
MIVPRVLKRLGEPCSTMRGCEHFYQRASFLQTRAHEDDRVSKG